MQANVYANFFAVEEKNWWFCGVRAMVRDWLQSATRQKSDLRLLDIGCGTGFWLSMLSELGEAHGLDFSAEAVAFCRARDLANVTRGSAEALPFDDASFDAVTMIGVIEHIDDDSAALREIHRVLRPGGVAILLTSAYQFLWTAHDDIVHHKRRYTMANFNRRIRAGGLQVTKSSYMNTLLFPGIAPVRIWQRWTNWSPGLITMAGRPE